MDNILRAEPEKGSKFAFQLIDVKVMDKLPPRFSYIDKSEIHGDDFLQLALDLEDKHTRCTNVMLFGCTEMGNSIMVRVNDFNPYLYYNKTEDKELFLYKLAALLETREDNLTVREVWCKNAYGWEPNKMEYPDDRKEHCFFQVFFRHVYLMRKAIIKTKCHEGQITSETRPA